MPAWAGWGQMMAIRTKSAAIAALQEVGIFMAKIGPYPRARRASRLWYNTVIFAFCSGRKGRKRPAGRSLIKLRPAFAYPAPTIADQNFLQITLIIPGQQTRRRSSRFTSPIQVVLPLL